MKTINGEAYCRESPTGTRLRVVVRGVGSFVPVSTTLNPSQAIRFAAQIQRLANKISERKRSKRRGSK